MAEHERLEQLRLFAKLRDLTDEEMEEVKRLMPPLPKAIMDMVDAEVARYTFLRQDTERDAKQRERDAMEVFGKLRAVWVAMSERTGGADLSTHHVIGLTMFVAWLARHSAPEERYKLLDAHFAEVKELSGIWDKTKP